MRQLPSRLRRLDGALADLPLDEPMLLTELDGFLTGILVSPEAVMPAEWMEDVWGREDDGGTAPFEDPLDVQWFADAVMARHNEIHRDLARGKLQPIFDIDERNGDLLWEMWIDGFAAAMALRPDAWNALAAGDDADTAAAVECLMLLIAVARDDGSLDSLQIDALQDQAPARLVDAVIRLHATQPRTADAPIAAPIRAPSSKVGRNEPCRCGSGRKSKRCCG